MKVELKLQGREKGCAQGCQQEYGTWVCWECPDPNAPTHQEIRKYMIKKEAQSKKIDVVQTMDRQEHQEFMDEYYPRKEA